jgi:hypothetical protein
MIDSATVIFRKKQEINRLTADIIKLRAKLAYLERQRDLENYQKFMESRRRPA